MSWLPEKNLLSLRACAVDIVLHKVLALLDIEVVSVNC